MSDLISRQDALERFERLEMLDTYETDGDIWLRVKAQDVYDMLLALPKKGEDDE